MIPAPKPPNEPARLRALRSYGLLDSAREINFDGVAGLAARLTGTPAALVTLVDEDRLWVKAGHATDLEEAPRDHAFCAHTILDPDRPLVVPDASRDPRFAGSPFVTGPAGIRFYAGQPLVNPQGLALGALCVVDRQPRRLSVEHREVLRALAGLLMDMLEPRRSAGTDRVTGLPDRNALAAALEEAAAAGSHGPVLLLRMELDGLPGGLGASDRLLRGIGQALSDLLGAGSVVARTGAGGFGLLVRRDACPRTLLAGLRSAVAAAGGVGVAASVGALTLPAGAACGSDALRLADEVLRSARAGSDDRFEHRVAGLPAQARADAGLEACP